MDIDFIIPVYREHPDVLRQTITDLKAALTPLADLDWQIIVVNDGSPPEFDYRAIGQEERVTLLVQPENRGYGAALKRGIRHSRAAWIGISDADGTYPVADFPRLIAHVGQDDMVVGARTTQVRNIPWPRRLPKYVLNRYSSFLAGQPIPDLNSGMRIFDREKALAFWSFYPDGFSFTSTITMAFMAHRYPVRYVPIDYHKRHGKSSIRPISDTRLFFQLVGRMGLYFNPLRVFLPVAWVLLLGAVGKAARDYLLEGHIGNLAVTFAIAAIQMYFMGLLAELIVRKSR